MTFTNLSPIAVGGKEPSDGEEEPPDGTRREEEVEHHGRHRAPPVVQRALLDGPLGEEVLGGVVDRVVAGDVVAVGVAEDEDSGGGAVAERQVYDGPLGVGEAVAVDEEGGDGEGAGGEGGERPGKHPRLRELDLVAVEEGDVVVARRTAILDHLGVIILYLSIAI